MKLKLNVGRPRHYTSFLPGWFKWVIIYEIYISTHISVVLYCGARILVPSFSLWQNSSSMWRPGYGEAPVGPTHTAVHQYVTLWLHFGRGGECHIVHLYVRCLRTDGRRLLPKEKISHSRMPKDHTSLWVVNTLSKMDSGDIHFRGRRACQPIRAQEQI